MDDQNRDRLLSELGASLENRTGRLESDVSHNNGQIEALQSRSNVAVACVLLVNCLIWLALACLMWKLTGAGAR